MILIKGHSHTLGQALYRARKDAGLTQVQLGAKVGICNARISELERARGPVTIKAQLWVQLMNECGWRIEAKKSKGTHG